MENAEINNIIKILGLQYKKNYTDPESLKSLRYGKIMIMTDQVRQQLYSLLEMWFNSSGFFLAFAVLCILETLLLIKCRFERYQPLIYTVITPFYYIPKIVPGSRWLPH